MERGWGRYYSQFISWPLKLRLPCVWRRLSKEYSCQLLLLNRYRSSSNPPRSILIFTLFFFFFFFLVFKIDEILKLILEGGRVSFLFLFPVCLSSSRAILALRLSTNENLYIFIYISYCSGLRSNGKYSSRFSPARSCVILTRCSQISIFP